MLTFEEQNHIYRWNGEIVPSVTQVLDEWRVLTIDKVKYHASVLSGIAIPSSKMEAAAEVGKAIHLGAKLILTDSMDWGAVDEDFIPPLLQFMRWMDDYKVKSLHIERPMYSVKHGVAGTPDIIGELQGFLHLGIIDIKTGLVNEAVGPQTGGYEIIFRDQEKYRKPIHRHELILPRDGSPYKFNPLTKTTDGAFFLSRLFQWQYLKEA